MKPTTVSAMIILVCAFLLFIDAGEKNFVQSEQQRFTHYLVGIKYLEHAQNLTLEEKLSLYKKLVELTGFDAQSAVDYTDKFKNDPQKWENIVKSVIDSLEQEQLPEKGVDDGR